MKRWKVFYAGIAIVTLALILWISSEASGIEVTREQNTATYITFPIVDVNGAVVSSAAGLDSEWVDFSDSNAPGTFEDCTNEATEIGSTGWYYLSIAVAETATEYAAIQVKTSTTGALNQHILMHYNVNSIDDVNALIQNFYDYSQEVNETAIYNAKTTIDNTYSYLTDVNETYIENTYDQSVANYNYLTDVNETYITQIYNTTDANGTISIDANDLMNAEYANYKDTAGTLGWLWYHTLTNLP